jgi:putative FmdB family regulatory protein
MPVYEYQCKACGRDFEYQQRMSDPDKTACEACGGALDRLISRTAFSLKGGGWYKDLYASPKPEGKSDGGDAKPAATDKPAAAADKPAAAADKPAAKSDSSGGGSSGGSSSGGSSSGGGSSGGSSSGGSGGSSSSSSGSSGGGSSGASAGSVPKAS